MDFPWQDYSVGRKYRRVEKSLKNYKLGVVIINWGRWKNLTKRFEFTQNLHEFERIRATLKNYKKDPKSFSNFLKLGGGYNKLKCLVKNKNFGN